MFHRELIIEGARQNNLKNITLRLPHNKVIAVTGVSGSGKSSLAFDTIFAEGQWRFIESLSTYARLFLEKLDRPDVDAIINIRPAIALEQRNPVKGSRSTVGTLTEIYDLLRVLYAKIATPYCPKCGRQIIKWDASLITAELLMQYRNRRAVILFDTTEALQSLKQRGFHRLWADNSFRDISEMPGNPEGPVEVVLDRLVIRDEPRLADSIETAWREGKGRLKVLIIGENGQDDSSLLFSSRNACNACDVSVPEPIPLLFSFNHPLCACPGCKGFGNTLIYDKDLIVPDILLSLSEGAIALWEKPGYRWWKDQMITGLKKTGINVHKPYMLLTKEDQELLYTGNEHFYGINDFFEDMENRRYKLHVRVLLSRYRSPVICPSCNGKRLCEDALAYKVEGLDIAEICTMPIARLLPWFEELHLSPMQKEISEEVLKQLRAKLRFLDRVGLGYLTLGRQAKTISGGEYQRVNLSNQLGSTLTGTLYVLDEPTIGLHPRDTRRIAAIMREISSLGNSVIVVEHDRDIIASSDWVVELGPGGGHLGGEVVFSGPLDEFLRTDTPTSRQITDRMGLDLSAGPSATSLSYGQLVSSRNSLRLIGASGNNLKNITISIPLGAMTVISGVSGSGKSSLIVETLYRVLARHFKTDTEHPLPYKQIDGVSHIRGVRLIDQTPLGRTPRSNPLTYLKIFDPVRKIYAQQPEAKAHGYAPGFFSFNIPGGRCETCKGEGYQRMEMYFFEDVFVKCEDCKGRRYKNEALKIVYKGKNISEILDMTVDEAILFFGEESEVGPKLILMRNIGLGYLRLGQPANTLSGGEAQRLKICAELSLSPRFSSKGIVYILDEPTVGLHYCDVKLFLNIIGKMTLAGNTVVIIEHNLDVITCADWVIDLGPEGGEEGGQIIFEGVPADLVSDFMNEPRSYTGKYLAERLSLKEISHPMK